MSQATSTKARPVVAAAEDGAGRSPGMRPQLLDQVPGTIYTSPGFIMGIVVAEFLYGLVLFAVMSGTKKEPVEHDVEPEPLAVLTPKVESIEPPKVEVKTPTPPPSEPKPKSEPSPPAKSASEPSKAATPAVTKDAAPPAPTSTSTPSPTSNTPPQGSAPARGAEVAATIAKPALPPPELPPQPQPQGKPTIDPLGPLIDPLNDCQTQVDGGALSVLVPPGIHVFGPDRDTITVPRALTETNGDFVAQVKVLGTIRPGTKPIDPLPFTFQGAGLLLWQDADNYVRLERAAGYSNDQGSLHQIMVESIKDGKRGKTVYVPAREGPIALRMERRKGEIHCTYSPDGKTWLPVKKWAAAYAPRVNIGISASNASPKPFSARFEDFSVKAAGKSG